MSGGMEDSSRTYDADGNRTDNVYRPRNISDSVRAEIAARRPTNNGAVQAPANLEEVPQAPAPELNEIAANQAAPNNNVPSPSPTGVNTFFSGSRSPNTQGRQGNISVAPGSGFVPPGFSPAAQPQPGTVPQVNPPAQAALAVDFAAIMAQVTQQLSSSLQNMQQQLARENEETILSVNFKLSKETSQRPKK
jgi:hypothetical protein